MADLNPRNSVGFVDVFVCSFFYDSFSFLFVVSFDAWA